MWIKGSPSQGSPSQGSPLQGLPLQGSALLLVNIRLRGIRLRLPLFLVLPLFVLQNLLAAWEDLLALIPAQYCKRLRGVVNTYHKVLTELIASRPQTIADVHISDDKQQVSVKVRTWGLGGKSC